MLLLREFLLDAATIHPWPTALPSRTTAVTRVTAGTSAYQGNDKAV
eukprot:CAMPEP_0172729904 /NCGR_PEP_ID=MMETSP1074-20121228/96321_1 /TAXON_ID=2916 /ORGANISM="Ceratium fusus, Strain PA161109" /LENGTH=45 /DNA_ID= /DNA_START= /DNA_END= /DNA_ORIENTATION=